MHQHIQIVLLAIICLILLYKIINHTSISDEYFGQVENNDKTIIIDNMFDEETTGPRKEIVLTTLSQCNSLCEENGNRPNVITAYPYSNDQHDTAQCIQDCRQFLLKK